MRILVDLRKISSKPSGIGIYTYNFVKALTKFKDIEIIGVSDILESEEILDLNRKINISLYGVKVDKTYIVVRYFKFIQSKINEYKPDLFWETNNIMPIKITNSYGKIMTTIHDIFPITSRENYKLMYRLYFRYCIKKTIKYSDNLVYVSNFTKSEVEKFFLQAKYKSNYISYNIVEINENSVELSEDNNYLLFIGNIEKRKGVDILIKAFKLYKDAGGEKKLYICGSIRDQSILEDINIMKKIGLDIEYKGYVSNKEKNELINKSSALVFPSRAEGFGIPIIESIAMNKKCIISNISVFKEVIGDNAIYFDLVDSVDTSAVNLKNAMLSYATSNIKCNKRIISKYNMNNLGTKFYNYILLNS